ncbi:hypothetical protein L1887_39163 [Cichorium endivia]|nr:hypothetical protein L1887_39163 [Cichorium endivia]
MSEPSLEEVNHDGVEKEEFDSCIGVTPVIEKLKDPSKEGTLGSLDRIHVEPPMEKVGLEQISNERPELDTEIRDGPKTHVDSDQFEDGLTPNRNGLSAKLKALLSRDTPIKEKVEAIEEEKKANFDANLENKMTNASSTVERRITRSQSRGNFSFNYRGESSFTYGAPLY